MRTYAYNLTVFHLSIDIPIVGLGNIHSGGIQLKGNFLHKNISHNPFPEIPNHEIHSTVTT